MSSRVYMYTVNTCKYASAQNGYINIAHVNIQKYFPLYFDIKVPFVFTPNYWLNEFVYLEAYRC